LKTVAEFGTIAETARRIKRELVHEHGDKRDEEASDLHAYVIVLRSGRQFAIVEVEQGPDVTSNAVYVGVLFFRAHEMYLVADARMRTYKQPDEIIKVQKGDYERDWKAGQREGMIESLIVTYLPLVGPPQMIAYPYERNGRQLHWLEALPVTTGMDGAVVDYARRGYEECQKSWPQIQTSLDMMADSLGVGPGEQEYRTDRAVAAYVTKQSEVIVSLFEAGLIFEAGKEVVYE
jgi:hypothetical protein